MSDASPNGSDPASSDSATPFERFERLTRRLVSVPKEEIDKQRKKASRASIDKRMPRTPG